MEIRNWETGEIIFSSKDDSIKECLKRAIKEGVNLRSADLSSANLISADLSSANLRSADLSSANLYLANLYSADLSSADLSSANLRSANLCSANLSSANLRSADLSSADLSSANLSSADLSSADLSSANGIYAFGPMPTSGRIVYAIIFDKKIIIQAGCFWGDLKEFAKQVKRDHNDSTYNLLIEFLSKIESNLK